MDFIAKMLENFKKDPIGTDNLHKTLELAKKNSLNTLSDNDTTISLPSIQEKRLNYFESLEQLPPSAVLNDLRKTFKNLKALPLDDIQTNIIIQEELLGTQLLKQQPSFYHAYIMPKHPELHHLFFEKLYPFITSEIFDNTKNAHAFVKKAILSYNESIAQIMPKNQASKNGWLGTGFEKIADDLFN